MATSRSERNQPLLPFVALVPSTAMTRANEFGQPIGESIGSFAPPSPPPVVDLTGRTTTLIVLDASEHSDGLFEAYGVGGDRLWTYLQWGPFATVADLRSQLTQLSNQPDWLPYVVTVGGRPEGLACFLRIDPPKASIEIGGITFGPRLQRTAASTEALSLMIGRAFDLGYRRVEWKCDDLNAPSKRAAQRLGFQYEGTFRKALHYKGRNRDTAWFSIVDDHWPSIRREHERWLAPTNFDAEGRQLSALTVGTGRGG